MGRNICSPLRCAAGEGAPIRKLVFHFANSAVKPFPAYKLGNIKFKTITEMMISAQQFSFGNDKRNKLSQKCIQCQFKKLCWGECPKNRIIRLEDGSSHNYLCQGLKHYFNHVNPYMKFMANELVHKRPPSNVMAWVKDRIDR